MTIVTGLTEEGELFRDTLTKFVGRESTFEGRTRRLHATPPDRLSLWRPLAEMGVQGFLFPPTDGGFGGTPSDLGVVQESLAVGLLVEPVLAATVIAGRLLVGCRADCAARLIDGIVAGDAVPVLAHAEGADPFASPKSIAIEHDGLFRLDGFKPAVRHADVATDFIVSALLHGEVALFHVAATATGLSRAGTRTIDAAGAADLTFRDVIGQRLDDGDALTRLVNALEWGLAGLAVETAALTRATLDSTIEYAKVRQQFGSTLASFQAIQHHIADMAIHTEEAAAMANDALCALADAPSSERSSRLLACGIACDAAARLVGHAGVQAFGGMGVSDETQVSHFLRRLTAIRTQIGGTDVRGARLAEFGLRVGGVQAGDRFRAEVREFVAQNLPAATRERVMRSRELRKEDYVDWQQILHEKGWFLGSWPEEWGGGGWTVAKQLVFAQEAAMGGAPYLIPYGLSMVGPILNRFGSEAQKAKWLPGIRNSETWWCQGYSEPGAGSDLAGLKTTAVRDGDTYTVNGSKLWTTEAHWADMMHCLVRTDASGRKQDGISYLLIDMKTPGLTVRPIVTIDGLHHTNEVFFDNVIVPVENRVGDEGAGWSIAKSLLEHERVSIADTGPKLRLFQKMQRMHARLLDDPDLSDDLRWRLTARLTDVGVRLETLRVMELHMIRGWSNGRPLNADASMLKLRGSQVLQAMSELGMDLQGPYAQIHDPHDLHAPIDGSDSSSIVASAMAHQYLYGRCWSIFGGTDEVQRNIIAKAALR